DGNPTERGLERRQRPPGSERGRTDDRVEGHRVLREMTGQRLGVPLAAPVERALGIVEGVVAPIRLGVAKQVEGLQARVKKQLSAPVWQAGPWAWTLSRMVSASQSSRRSSTSRKLPEVAPFSQSPRLREWNQAWPVA